MKCDNCGYMAQEGDQVCVNCGSRLSLNPKNNESLKYVKYRGKNKRVWIIVLSIIVALCFLGLFLLKVIKG